MYLSSGKLRIADSLRLLTNTTTNNLSFDLSGGACPMAHSIGDSPQTGMLARRRRGPQHTRGSNHEQQQTVKGRILL